MSDDATPGNVPLSDLLGPVAEVKCGRLQWAIPRDDYRRPLRFLNNDTHPLYDQAALDAAVAAERERCVRIIESHQVPVGNSAAGEMAAEWTMDALREVRVAIRGA